MAPHPPSPSPTPSLPTGRGGAIAPPLLREKLFVPARRAGRRCPLSRLGGVRWERGSGGEVSSLHRLHRIERRRPSRRVEGGGQGQAEGQEQDQQQVHGL